MKHLDISLDIADAPIQPELPTLVQSVDVAQAILQLQFTSNTGTHIHIPQDLSWSQLIEQLNGSCRVISLRSSPPHITLKDLQAIKPVIAPGSRILFKTANGKLLNQPIVTTDFVTFSEAAVQFLADRRLSLLGWDYLLLDNKPSSDFSISDYLLQHQIPLLMGLELRDINIGEYKLTCLPLKLSSSIVPARAILTTR